MTPKGVTKVSQNVKKTFGQMGGEPLLQYSTIIYTRTRYEMPKWQHLYRRKIVIGAPSGIKLLLWLKDYFDRPLPIINWPRVFTLNTPMFSVRSLWKGSYMIVFTNTIRTKSKNEMTI